MRRSIVVALLFGLVPSMTASAVVRLQVWLDTDVSSAAAALAVARGGTPPSMVDTLLKVEWPTWGADHYVAYVAGFLVPPASGDYTFYVTGDDRSSLALSEDADLTKAAEICSVSVSTSANQWTRYASQRSAARTLIAGNAYAFYLVMSESSKSDGAQVGWTGPAPIGAAITVIDGQYVLEGHPTKAWGPAPWPGSVDLVSPVLSWNAPMAPNAGYVAYLGTDPAALAWLGETTATALGSAAWRVPGQLAYDTTYYWRVDPKGGPAGDVWSFTTKAGTPYFTAWTGAAARVGKKGDLTVTAAGPDRSTITYQWYKASGDPCGVDSKVAGATKRTLTLGYPAVGDPNEGTYYCVATDAVGSTRSPRLVFDGQEGLVHRYTFNAADVDGNTIKDVAGGPAYDGLLHAVTGQDQLADGRLTLGNSGQSSKDGKGSYVDLPNGMISSLGTQMTVEVWWTQMGTENWACLWNFGTSNGGEDLSSGADRSTYVKLCPRDAVGRIVSAFRNSAAKGSVEKNVQAYPPGPTPLNQEALFTVVWNEVVNRYSFYYNGIIVGQTTLNMTLRDLVDNNNWIGRSQEADPYINGSIDELRIWDTALLPSDIAWHAVVGPNDTSLFQAGPCSLLPVNDLNGDCEVDFIDYAMLIEKWMSDTTAIE